MSRKTRRLIWSAPLVAVLAVAGVLAMFVALEPGSVFANPLPAAPMNLEVEAAAGNAGRTTLVLTWDAPAGGNVTGYRIDKSDNGFVWETLETNAGAMTTYMDGPLTSEDTRWYRVFAVNDHGVSPVSNPNSGTTKVKGKPGPVRTLTASAGGQKQINLMWQAPADYGGEEITGYRIEFHDGEGAWTALEGTGLTAGFLAEKTTYQDMNSAATFKLDPGDMRRYRVRAYNVGDGTSVVDGDFSDWQNTQGTTSAAGNPSPPSGLTAVNASAGNVNLYWFAPENTGGWGVTHYIIQARPIVPRSTWKALPDPAAILAVDAYDSGAITDLLSHNFRIAAPAAGSTPSVTQHTQQVTETWDHDADDADATPPIPLVWEFRVYAETTDDGPDDNVGIAADNKIRRSASHSETSSVVTGERATFDADTADATNTLVDRYAAPRGTATTATTADVEDEQIDLTVQVALDNEGVTSQTAYRIDVLADDGINWKPLVSDTRFTNFGADRVYEHQGLPYDAIRTYRVFTIQNNWRTSVGPATDPGIVGSTTASEVPGKATGLSASAPDLNTVAASWTAPEDDGGHPVDHYRFEYVIDDDDGISEQEDFTKTSPAAGKTSDANVTVTMNGNAVMATIKVASPGLMDESLYQVRVAAVTLHPTTKLERPIAGNEAWLDAAEFKTGELIAPDAVEGLTSELATDASGTARGIDLLWNKAMSGANIDHYVIERSMDGGTTWESPTDDAEMSTEERTSYTDPDELEMDEMRVYRVAAENDADKSPWVMVYYPRDPAAAHPHALPDVGDASGFTATAGSATGTAVLTWTPGTDANVHWVLGIAMNADGSFDYNDPNRKWMKVDSGSPYTVTELTAVKTYSFAIISGYYDASLTPHTDWSNWVWAADVMVN